MKNWVGILMSALSFGAGYKVGQRSGDKKLTALSALNEILELNPHLDEQKIARVKEILSDPGVISLMRRGDFDTDSEPKSDSERKLAELIDLADFQSSSKEFDVHEFWEFLGDIELAPYLSMMGEKDNKREKFLTWLSENFPKEKDKYLLRERELFLRTPAKLKSILLAMKELEREEDMFFHFKKYGLLN